MAHIEDLPLMGDARVALGILSSCVITQPFYFTWTIIFSSFLPFLASFDERIMKVCGDIMGIKSWESFQGPLIRHHAQLLISFSGICLLFMEDYAPSVFLKSWVLVVPYLCSRFHIFNGPVLEEYVFQVEGHLFQSCLCVTQDGLPLTARVMHHFLKSLAVIDTLGLQTSLMDFHHDTPFSP